jgi:hypothetical protein
VSFFASNAYEPSPHAAAALFQVSVVRVQLTKKFAQVIDDVDLRRFSVGQVVNVPQRDARILIAEGWAVRYEARGRKSTRSTAAERAVRRTSAKTRRR